MKKEKKIYLQQKKRYLKKIIGTINKPRLSVFKSNNHIYAQIINDEKGHTLAFSSTLNKIVFNNQYTQSKSTQAAAFLVGEDLAKKALQKNITEIVFDRGSHPYHGRVKSIADGARKQGLIF